MKYRYITNNYSGVLANCDIGIQNKNDIENDRQSTINVGGWTDGEERRRRRGLAGTSIGGSSYHATDGMIRKTTTTVLLLLLLLSIIVDLRCKHGCVVE